mgnify:CR=1 FL=1|jgi:hypothetical protein|tara:strand:- start:527 stop:781 length:255 start_codon:yes stop_codon:yes gene_type:complete
MIKKKIKDTKEFKEARFIKTGEHRVSMAVKKLELLSEMSNIDKYEYTDLQLEKIITILDEKFKEMKQSFSKGLSKKGDKKPFQF